MAWFNKKQKIISMKGDNMKKLENIMIGTNKKKNIVMKCNIIIKDILLIKFGIKLNCAKRIRNKFYYKVRFTQ
jgi:hypothetical protein